MSRVRVPSPAPTRASRVAKPGTRNTTMLEWIVPLALAILQSAPESVSKTVHLPPLHVTVAEFADSTRAVLRSMASQKGMDESSISVSLTVLHEGNRSKFNSVEAFEANALALDGAESVTLYLLSLGTPITAVGID